MTKTEIKQNIHELIDTVEDESKLEEIQGIIDIILTDAPIKPESIGEAERASIKRGIEQLNAGEKIDYEDVKKNYPEWLRK